MEVFWNCFETKIIPVKKIIQKELKKVYNVYLKLAMWSNNKNVYFSFFFKCDGSHSIGTFWNNSVNWSLKHLETYEVLIYV